MNKILIVFLCLSVLTACGNQARDVEAVGQVKRITPHTPIFCPEYTDVDLSLGIIQNGTGSMSTQDIWINISKPEDIALVKSANAMGRLVKITHNVQRFHFCTMGRDATKVELLP